MQDVDFVLGRFYALLGFLLESVNNPYVRSDLHSVDSPIGIFAVRNRDLVNTTIETFQGLGRIGQLPSGSRFKRGGDFVSNLHRKGVKGLLGRFEPQNIPHGSCWHCYQQCATNRRVASSLVDDPPRDPVAGCLPHAHGLIRTLGRTGILR